MIAFLVLLTCCAALRSHHEEPSASDDVVPHAVNCQAGAPEKGCASICHWLEMTQSDTGCEEFVEKIKLQGYKEQWVPGKSSSMKPILKVLETNCDEEELVFFLKVLLQLIDKMPEQKRSVKYKVEMFDLHSRVLKLLNEKDPDFEAEDASCQEGDTKVPGCMSVCRRLDLTKSSENGQCADFVEALVEKGYKKRSSWKVFGKTSAMDPILTILRMNCKEQEITFYTAALLQIIKRMPQEKREKYGEELQDLQSHVSFFLVAQVDEELEEDSEEQEDDSEQLEDDSEDDYEPLPQCDREMKLEAGDIVSFENGGPDFVRDVSGGLDQVRAEHEALQIKKHFRYGRHFDYSKGLFKIEEDSEAPPDLEKPNYNLKQEPEPVAADASLLEGPEYGEFADLPPPNLAKPDYNLKREPEPVAPDFEELEDLDAPPDLEKPNYNLKQEPEPVAPWASLLEAPDEVSELEEKKVEGKIKKRLVKYSKYLANGVFKVGKVFADIGVNGFKGISDLLLNLGVVVARGLVWGAARVTALYGRVKQTTPYTGDVRFTHTGLAVGENQLAEAAMPLGVTVSDYCINGEPIQDGEAVISRFVGDGTLDAERYRKLAGARGKMWSEYLKHYSDTVGQWHRVVMGKCYSKLGTPGQKGYFEAVSSERVKEMWDYIPGDSEASEALYQDIADSQAPLEGQAESSPAAHPAPKAPKKPKAMFCSKYAAAVWSSTIGNPTAEPSAAVRKEDLRKMLPLNPGACSPWAVLQWLLGKQGRKYWKSCQADWHWNPCKKK